MIRKFAISAYINIDTIGYLILGTFLVLLFGYIALDYFMLKKDYDLTRRIKYFFLSIFFLSLGAFFPCSGISSIINSIDLSNNGIEVVATVKESKVETRYGRRSSGTDYINTLIYDGWEKEFDLDKAYAIGTKLYLVYSVKNPNNARVSRLKESFIEYFFDVESLWSFVILKILFPLFWIPLGVRYIILLFKKESTLTSTGEE